MSVLDTLQTWFPQTRHTQTRSSSPRSMARHAIEHSRSHGIIKNMYNEVSLGTISPKTEHRTEKLFFRFFGSVSVCTSVFGFGFGSYVKLNRTPEEPSST